MGKKKQRFLSLVWQAIISVSAATLLGAGSIMLVGQYTLNKNYQQERKRHHQAYEHAFHGILQQIKNDRIDITWLIPSLLDSSLPADRALKSIDKIIEKNWPWIELESQLLSVFLYDKNGRSVGNWGDPERQPQFAQWLAMVIEKEVPYDHIVCVGRCIHYRVTPFLYNGDFLGIFIIGIDIGDMVLKLKNVIGRDAAILTTVPSKGAHRNIFHIDSWGVDVIALTGYDANSALLTSISRRYEGRLPKGSYIVKHEGNTYDLISLPFDDIDGAYLLVIDEITAAVSNVKQAISLYLVSGLLSLIFSGGVLLFLFIGPSKRLKNLANVLTMIAKKKYDAVAKHLQVPKHMWVRDEIDVLDIASHVLVKTLKELDSEVAQRTKRLSDQTLELLKEKNFIDNILNTAHVIIMTIDSQGAIQMVNNFTELLLGYSEAELVGKQFGDVCFSNSEMDAYSDPVDYWLDTKNRNLQCESRVFAQDGGELFISWFMSPLFTGDPELETNSETLIVGLDLTERKKSENRLTWLAEHDPLTGLYNRRKFEKELERAINFAQRYGYTSAVVFFDIDQFKYINDSSGHQVGDQLLVKVAEKLQHITRSTDIVARFGGDEFIILASNIEEEKAEELAQKLCNELSTVVIESGGVQHRTSISAGLLMFPEADCSVQDLLASADVAMYRAKEEGRGGWRRAGYDDINRHEIKSRVSWKTKIEEALQQNRFVLYYQPIMKIADRSISHYECLLRMIGEDGEIIPPAKFIDVAEKTGLIRQIDQYVIKLAFGKMAELLSEDCHVKFAINLSADMLSNPEAFNIITRHLQEYRLAAQHFIFEVTETQAVTRLQAAHDLILQIESIGGSFSLDDFGVGFSSMNYLKQLPVNFLKIDGSFIKNLIYSREDQLFVNAINSVGQGMNIKTVAEFVENQEIFDVLATMGVDYAQGYGIGRAQPQLEFHQHQVPEGMRLISKH